MGRLTLLTTEQTPSGAFALQAAQLTASAFVGLLQGEKRIGVAGFSVIGAVGVNLRARHAHVDSHQDRDLAESPAEDADVALSNPGITVLQPLADLADAGVQGARPFETTESDIQHGCRPQGFSQKVRCITTP